MRGIQVSPKEKEIGLKVKCFTGDNLEHAYKLKDNWLSKSKNIQIVKVKHSVVHGRGRVVGKWVSSKVYVSFINKEYFEVLKEFRRNRSIKKYD